MFRRIRSLKMLWFALLLAMLLAGCAVPQPAAEPEAPTAGEADTRTVEHAMGTTEVECRPQRVVTLGQGATDAALALGVTPVGAVDPWGTAGTTIWWTRSQGSPRSAGRLSPT